MAKRRDKRPRSSGIDLPSSVLELLGAEADALRTALLAPAPASIRYNPAKPSPTCGEQVPWCTNGRYLEERPVFTLDPLFHAGCFYVQEASSMLLEQAVLASGLAGADVLGLDLCAAPGGKSTHLASLLGAGSLLVCNEAVAARRPMLMENLWKHGCANTMITGSLPNRFEPLGGMFDLILVDAPCSGEGMFRKDPFSREQWSEGLVRSCARTQQDILRCAWAALRPGGSLIYSTCTWERSENEDQVLRLVADGAEFVPLPIDPVWGVITTDAGYRCYPHRLKGEGFFIALVRKPGERIGRNLDESDATPLQACAEWLDPGERWHFTTVAETLVACPAAWAAAMHRLSAHLHVLSPGIPIAERKGEAWRPHAALALNRALRPEAFPSNELDRTRCLDYLRGATMNEQGAKGVRLVRHEGHALGWVHGAGDRWNNGWPKPWRIRMR